jgi:hypothetical protein
MICLDMVKRNLKKYGCDEITFYTIPLKRLR